MSLPLVPLCDNCRLIGSSSRWGYGASLVNVDKDICMEACNGMFNCYAFRYSTDYNLDPFGYCVHYFLPPSYLAKDSFDQGWYTKDGLILAEYEEKHAELHAEVGFPKYNMYLPTVTIPYDFLRREI